jgi:signal peptidase II
MKKTNFPHAFLVFGIALVCLAIDQASKTVALADLPRGESVVVIPDLLWWRLAFNDGAAFSIGSGMTWIFTLISTAAVLLLSWYGPKASSTVWLVISGLVLGGASGNLIDRLVREPGFANGHVVDFIQIPFNFAIFNLADSFLVIGISLAVYRTIRGDNIGGHVRN